MNPLTWFRQWRERKERRQHIKERLDQFRVERLEMELDAFLAKRDAERRERVRKARERFGVMKAAA